MVDDPPTAPPSRRRLVESSRAHRVFDQTAEGVSTVVFEAFPVSVAFSSDEACLETMPKMLAFREP